jgi:L-asparaginase / beta-aspartyl-peptidase
MAPIAIGIHGGCGTLDVSLMSDSEWAEAREHLADALRAGWAILSQGGRSLDAVTVSVAVMEDSWHFNAGFGAALNAAGEHELDASIMDGATFGAGAVCGVRQVRNPIRAARAVMERSPSVLIAGSAADAFAASCGLDMVTNSYFTTDRRRAALAAIKAKEASGQMKTATEAEKHGTVGAVALDTHGHLAAGTSTGGFNNKPVGRVGDSPIIGAGTYARNGVCAVSGTGQGEIFIKRAAAYDVAARMIYAKADLAAATGAVVATLGTHNIGAGLVACDSNGNVVAPFNTLGMYRGWVTRDGDMTVATHKAEVHMGRLP